MRITDDLNAVEEREFGQLLKIIELKGILQGQTLADGVENSIAKYGLLRLMRDVRADVERRARGGQADS